METADTAAVEQPTQTEGPSADELVTQLTPLSPQEAEYFLREVGWAERLDVYVSSASTGAMEDWIRQARHAYNFLQGSSEAFLIDIDEMRVWVRDVLGDHELAERIGGVLAEVPDQDENDILNKVWNESDPERQAEARREASVLVGALTAARSRAREDTARFIGERIAQCEKVLGVDD
ncbi:MAG: hypothetical protein ACYDHQ_04920 [Coriobacteriia bacterium]